MIALDLPPKLWVPEKPAIVRAASLEFRKGLFLPGFIGAPPITPIPFLVGVVNNPTIGLSAYTGTTTRGVIANSTQLLIVVYYYHNTATGNNISSITDGVNTYSILGGLYGTGGSHMEFWRTSASASAIPSGTTITINFGTAPVTHGVAAMLIGMYFSTGFDTGASGNFSNTGSPSNSTGTLAQAINSIIGMQASFNNNGLSGTWTEPAGFTQLGQVYPGTNWGVSAAYKRVNATSSVTYNPTNSNTSSYGSSAVLTFKQSQ